MRYGAASRERVVRGRGSSVWKALLLIARRKRNDGARATSPSSRFSLGR